MVLVTVLSSKCLIQAVHPFMIRICHTSPRKLQKFINILFHKAKNIYSIIFDIYIFNRF